MITAIHRLTMQSHMSYSSCSCFVCLTGPYKCVSFVLEQFKFGSLSTFLLYWQLDVRHGTSCMMHLYSVLLLYNQSALQSCGGGGSLLNHHQCAAATGQRRQCAHHTPATGGEERVNKPNKWKGIIRSPWLTRASGGNLARTPGLHPTLLREVPWDF